MKVTVKEKKKKVKGLRKHPNSQNLYMLIKQDRERYVREEERKEGEDRKAEICITDIDNDDHLQLL